MIDLLALELPLLLLLLWLVRKRRELDSLLWPAAGVAAVFHALALLRFFTAPVPGFVLTGRLSPAFSAGVRGEGKVLAVGGRAPGSLGRLAAALLHGEGARIETTRGTYEVKSYGLAWRPWEALDSYALEEATGGLMLTKRQPVFLSRGGDAFILQITTPDASGGIRIERAAGKPVDGLHELFSAIGAMPEGGITPLRVMRPTPDDNVSTVIFSPSMMPPPPAGEAEGVEDRLARTLGLTGAFTLAESPATAPLLGFPERLNGQAVYGPRTFLRAYSEALATEKGEATFRFRSGDGMLWRKGEGGRFFVRPRVGLLPWIGPDAFTSWAVGVPFSPVRQALGLAGLRLILRHLAFVPRQLYNLDDDPFAVPGFVFYRLSSLFVSIFLALLAWRILRPRIARYGRPPSWARGLLVLSLALLLQLGDLLVVLYGG